MLSSHVIFSQAKEKEKKKNISATPTSHRNTTVQNRERKQLVLP